MIYLGVLTLKSSLLLGEISYSIYLVHGLVLFIIFTQFELIKVSKLTLDYYLCLMPIFSVAMILICTATYLFIERPSFIFGKNYLVTMFISKITKIK